MMMRIAMPKGRLLRPALGHFARAGFTVPDDDALESRRLLFHTTSGDGLTIEWIVVKDGDLTTYVAHGAADLGIAGLDQIREKRPDVMEIAELPFGFCRMMLIGRGGEPSWPVDVASRGPVATKYPAVAREWLRTRAPQLDVVPLEGSVELAAVLGLAPLIIDLVETGTTMRIHGLEAIEELFPVTPRLIVNRDAWRVERRMMQQIVRSLNETSEELAAGRGERLEVS